MLKFDPKSTLIFTTLAGAKYDLDVNNRAEITNIDTNKSGSQVLKATYSYGDVIKDVSKTITVR